MTNLSIVATVLLAASLCWAQAAVETETASGAAAAEAGVEPTPVTAELPETSADSVDVEEPIAQASQSTSDYVVQGEFDDDTPRDIQMQAQDSDFDSADRTWSGGTGHTGDSPYWRTSDRYWREVHYEVNELSLMSSDAEWRDANVFWEDKDWYQGKGSNVFNDRDHVKEKPRFWSRATRGVGAGCR